MIDPMSPEYDAATEIRDALTALKEEMGGVLVLTETVGVIAAQMMVNGATLKLILAALQAGNATTIRGRDEP